MIIKYSLIIFIIFVFTFISCDLLKTRDTSPPIKPREDWNLPTTPEILIQNLKTAIENKIVENYQQCFIDTNLIKKNYKFIPTSESMQIYANIFSNWNIASERTYFINLKTKLGESSKLQVLFTEEKYSTVQNDSINYSAKYQLISDKKNPFISSEYAGNLELTLYRNISGLWAIGIWSDYKSSSNDTWSQLKGSFSY